MEIAYRLGIIEAHLPCHGHGDRAGPRPAARPPARATWCHGAAARSRSQATLDAGGTRPRAVVRPRDAALLRQDVPREGAGHAGFIDDTHRARMINLKTRRLPSWTASSAPASVRLGAVVLPPGRSTPTGAKHGCVAPTCPPSKPARAQPRPPRVKRPAVARPARGRVTPTSSRTSSVRCP